MISIQDILGGPTADLVRDWKAEAKKDWVEAGHGRWTIVKEHLVSSNNLIAALLAPYLFPSTFVFTPCSPRIDDLVLAPCSPCINGLIIGPTMRIHISIFHPCVQELAGSVGSNISPRPSIAGDMRSPSHQVRIDLNMYIDIFI